MPRRDPQSVATHRSGRLRHIAQAGVLQYTPPELRLRRCPQCDHPAVLCPDTGVCPVCKPTRYSFGLRRMV